VDPKREEEETATHSEQREGRGISDLTVGSISLLRGWSNTGTGFLERWLIPQACQRLGGIWMMP